jgi:hypothetical protein
MISRNHNVRARRTSGRPRVEEVHASPSATKMIPHRSTHCARCGLRLACKRCWFLERCGRGTRLRLAASQIGLPGRGGRSDGGNDTAVLFRIHDARRLHQLGSPCCELFVVVPRATFDRRKMGACPSDRVRSHGAHIEYRVDCGGNFYRRGPDWSEHVDARGYSPHNARLFGAGRYRDSCRRSSRAESESLAGRCRIPRFSLDA